MKPIYPMLPNNMKQAKSNYCKKHNKHNCPTCTDELISLGIQASKDRIADLEKQNTKLLRVIALYASHDSECAIYADIAKPCSCGLDDTLLGEEK